MLFGHLNLLKYSKFDKRDTSLSHESVHLFILIFSPDVFPDLLGLPIVKEIADNHGKTPAQVLLHFLVKQQIVVIPKSTSVLRLKVKETFEFFVKHKAHNY